jgi:ribonuclease PH
MVVNRIDGRNFDELRPVVISTGVQAFAEGSALIEMGRTRVLCAVSTEEKVPPFLRGGGTGWVTAEYAMLPRATPTRSVRDSTQGRVSGRSHEIQRLIGRCLRAVTDMSQLGERSLIIDCDVLQADGGTRTAAITGAYVALYQALQKLVDAKIISKMPLKSSIAATSVGVVKGKILLDLCYEEDCKAEVDFNLAMTGKGEFVEVQGTAENKPFSKDTLDAVVFLATKGIKQLFDAQQQAIEKLKPGSNNQ